MHAAGIGSPARYRLPGTSMAALKAEGVTSDHAYCTAQISRTRRSPPRFSAEDTEEGPSLRLILDEEADGFTGLQGE